MWYSAAPTLLLVAVLVIPASNHAADTQPFWRWHWNGSKLDKVGKARQGMRTDGSRDTCVVRFWTMQTRQLTAIIEREGDG